jgi:hypothetical protein
MRSQFQQEKYHLYETGVFSHESFLEIIALYGK